MIKQRKIEGGRAPENRKTGRGSGRERQEDRLGMKGKLRKKRSKGETGKTLRLTGKEGEREKGYIVWGKTGKGLKIDREGLRGNGAAGRGLKIDRGRREKGKGLYYTVRGLKIDRGRRGKGKRVIWYRKRQGDERREEGRRVEARERKGEASRLTGEEGRKGGGLRGKGKAGRD